MPVKKLLRKIGFVVALLFLTANISAEQDMSALTVVIPQVRPPFDKVFAEIFAGIQHAASGQVISVVVDDDVTSGDVRKMLQARPAGPVIGLGNQVKNLLKPLEQDYRIVYGAVFLNPEEEAKNREGISLTPSPDATFKWLHTMVPEIKTVHVVYQNNYSGWLVTLAEEAVSQHGLTLIKHPVSHVREAALAFRDILDNSDPATHAVWLMQRDPSLDEKAVLPDILAQAWSRNFIVFSSNPAHVPRGALFALYPDNQKMGESLARMALKPARNGIIPLDDLLIAVNIRTASHVGKNFARGEEKQFDLIFPNR